MKNNNKKNKTYSKYIDNQSEFDHQFACWANNHNGWVKMKRKNKRIAKKRERRESRDFEYDEFI